MSAHVLAPTKKLTSLTFFSIFFLFYQSNEASASPPTPAKVKIEVVTENWKPYSYEENGKIKGTATEIVKKVLSRIKTPFKINIYPWARAYMMAQRSTNTLIYPIVRTPEREKLFHWIGQVAPTDRAAFYKLKSRKDIVIKNLEDAKKFIVGTNRDSDKHQFLKKQMFKNLFIESEQKLTVTQLVRGRIDLMIMKQINLESHLKELGFTASQFEKTIEVYDSRPFMAYAKQTNIKIVAETRRIYKNIIDNKKPCCKFTIQ